MDRNLVFPRSIRYLIAVADMHSFTRAAEAPYVSPPVRRIDTNSWLSHFQGAWRNRGDEHPHFGQANYISDKLAETDPAAARYLRGRTPESCALKRGTSVSSEESLMSPFFERAWWPAHHAAWSIGDSVPPARGWSAHDGGRNQLYLDFHAYWIRRDIE